MRTRTTAPDTATNGTANGHTSRPTSGDSIGQAADPLSDAEAIRGLLRDVDTRLGRLVTYLKHHRRQSRGLRTAMDSLRGLTELVP